LQPGEIAGLVHDWGQYQAFLTSRQDEGEGPYGQAERCDRLLGALTSDDASRAEKTR
jgi:hypothetical protein